MTTPIHHPEAQAQRQRILDAAEARFRVYGYGKTTMAEIAEDAAMSAANLYRYFESKQDIAAACASRCIGEGLDKLRGIVRQPGLAAGVRLEGFVMGLIDHTYQSAQDQPKINELIDVVARERQDIVHSKIQAQCALISEILSHGNETGEFAVADVITTARVVHTTLIFFGVPLFLPLYSRAEIESQGRQVAALLLVGLRKR
jgi:AcrR family transcriptional regulator